MSSKTSSRLGLTFSLKLSILYATFFVISSVGLFGVTWYFLDSFLSQRENEIIHARIEEYRAWYKEGGLAALKTRFYEQTSTSRDIFFVRVAGPRNRVLFYRVPPGAQRFDTTQLNFIGPRWTGPVTLVNRSDPKTKSTWILAAQPLGGNLVIQVGKSLTGSQELLSHFRRIFFYSIIPILLLGIAGGGLLTFRAMRPVRSLIQTVRDILNTGKISMRVPVRSEKGEMGELVSLFNQMLNKNDALISAMRHSLDNVAHDLRTPMTRLRGAAELALAKPDDHEALKDALSDSMEESERVLTMLNTLMDVAEAETGVMHLDIGEVDLKEMIGSVAELYEIVADEKEVTVQSRCPDGLMAMADRTRMQQALANLVDNAVKYSLDGGRVTIEAREEEGHTAIVVSDQGIGISPLEIDRIWDRLYRGDASRSERGLGLGLSFVKAIVSAHKGEVLVQSAPGEGATFTVLLPGNDLDTNTG